MNHQAVGSTQGTEPPVATPSIQTLFTVKQLAVAEPGLTVGGIRQDLFHRETNGLAEADAIVWRGKNLLLHRTRYLTWLFSRSRGGRRGAA